MSIKVNIVERLLAIGKLVDDKYILDQIWLIVILSGVWGD